MGPFRSGTPRLVMHSAYHKVGTAWFNSILYRVATNWGIGFVSVQVSKAPVTAPCIAFDIFSNLTERMPGPFRGTHMIRDPRDVIVSGYHYHRQTQEKWVLAPMRENPLFGEVVKLEPTFAERSYQELLNVLSKEEGLRMEVLVASALTITPMASWDYHQPHFLELMYEKVFEDGPAWFEQIFDHYGLRPSAVREAMAIAEERSFAKLSESRDPARDIERRHLRSGKPEQWKEEFTPAVSDLFRTMHGLHLIHLGYERSLDW